MEQNIFIPHWPFLLDDENRPIQQQRIVHNERFLIQGECKKLLSTHSFLVGFLTLDVYITFMEKK